jgi:hypothetical protein
MAENLKTAVDTSASAFFSPQLVSTIAAPAIKMLLVQHFNIWAIDRSPGLNEFIILILWCVCLLLRVAILKHIGTKCNG